MTFWNIYQLWHIIAGWSRAAVFKRNVSLGQKICHFNGTTHWTV